MKKNRKLKPAFLKSKGDQTFHCLSSIENELESNQNAFFNKRCLKECVESVIFQKPKSLEF